MESPRKRRHLCSLLDFDLASFKIMRSGMDGTFRSRLVEILYATAQITVARNGSLSANPHGQTAPTLWLFCSDLFGCQGVL